MAGKNTFEIYNLDEKPGIVVFSVAGKPCSFTKDQLVELVRNAQEAPFRALNADSVNKLYEAVFYKDKLPDGMFGRPKGGRSLASLGKKISNLYMAQGKKKTLTEEQEFDLVSYLKTFDGVIPQRNKSKLPKLLNEIAGWKVSEQAKIEIKTFLSTYGKLLLP